MYWREGRAFASSTSSARDKFARLIGTDFTEIAIVKNVSEGINAIATAIPWRAGDNVVLCAGLEHPNNVLPWVHLRRLGVEMRVVEPVAGAIEPEAMIAAIDGRTRVVTASSVTFAPGLRVDLGAIGRACRSRDVLFLVDAVQSAGISPSTCRATISTRWWHRRPRACSGCTAAASSIAARPGCSA